MRSNLNILPFHALNYRRSTLQVHVLWTLNNQINLQTSFGKRLPWHLPLTQNQT